MGPGNSEFPLTLSENPFPEELISLIRLFVDEDAWAKAKKKGKVPKPKIEHDEIGGKIVKVLVGAVEIRGEMYGKGISFEVGLDRTYSTREMTADSGRCLYRFAAIGGPADESWTRATASE